MSILNAIGVLEVLFDSLSKDQMKMIHVHFWHWPAGERNNHLFPLTALYDQARRLAGAEYSYSINVHLSGRLVLVAWVCVEKSLNNSVRFSCKVLAAFSDFC